MRHSSSIREILDQVEGYDVVLTIDRALADGLNEMRGGPRLGPFAMTPRDLASRNAGPMLGADIVDEHVTVISIAREMGIDLRQAHALWREHVDLATNGIDSDEVGEKGGMTLIEAMRRIGQRPLEGKDVAVIDRHLFSAMDLLMVPDVCLDVRSITGNVVPVKGIKTFPQRRQIVDWVVSGIDGGNMEDVAIVLSYRSPYLNLFNTALQRKGIDVSTGGLLRDDLRVRTLFDALGCALDRERATVGDVRAFGDVLGLDPLDSDDRSLLGPSARDDEGARRAVERLDSLAHSTWDELIGTMDISQELSGIIDALDLSDVRVDAHGLEDVRYLVDSFPVQVTQRRKGVAILDCLSSAFVNRPVCFMIGIDEDWSMRPPTDPRIDRGRFVQRERDRFVTLLQQGEVTIRPVVESDERGEVLPCHHLCVEEGVRSFRELDVERHTFHSPTMGSELDVKEGKGREVTMLSASSMNRYLTCPRRYMLDALTGSADSPALRKGNALHEYLGLRAQERNLCIERRDGILDAMVGTMSILVPEASLGLMRTDLMLGMRSIDRYLDRLIEIVPFDGDVSVKDNSLMRRFGIQPIPGIGELGFEDESLGIRGFIDLHVREGHITDLKTGRSRNLREIALGCIPSLMDGDVDVQPTMYLLWSRTVNGRDPAVMDLFYCMHDRNAYVSGHKSIGVVRTVRYMPLTLQGYLSTREGWDRICEGRRDNSSLVAAGMDGIADVVREHGCDSVRVGRRLDGDPMLDELRARWPNYWEDIIDAAIESRLTKGKNEVMVFDDDLDDLETMIADCLRGMNEGWRTGFPAHPRSRGDCDGCPYRDMCTEESL